MSLLRFIWHLVPATAFFWAGAAILACAAFCGCRAPKIRHKPIPSHRVQQQAIKWQPWGEETEK